MTITCPEVTYISCLFLSLASSLVGFLSPYWQVDQLNPDEKNVVQIAVGLNYACVKEIKAKGTINTYCKPLPTGAHDGIDSSISGVRWLMVFHVIFMIINFGLNLSSPTCIPKRQAARRVAAVAYVLTLVMGISGLSVVSMNISNYENLFKLQFPEVNGNSRLCLGWSFYLSCTGCALFAIVGSVEMAVRLRDICKTKQQERERRLLLKDEIRIVYGSPSFFMDATYLGDQNDNNIWLPVETCQVDLFKGIFPVHDERKKSPKFLYSLKD